MSINNSQLWLENKKQETENKTQEKRMSINNSYLWLEENREAGRQN